MRLLAPYSVLSVVFVAVMVMSFQNCSNKTFLGYTGDDLNQGLGCDPDTTTCVPGPDGPTLTTCMFNGQVVDEGGQVTAYLNSSVAAGQTCQSEVRTCTLGQLTGSYQYATCAPVVPRACLFNGVTIPHGQSVTAYLASTSPAGQSCQSEERVCTDGSLSGSYNYSSCTNSGPAACLFNGQTVAHGSAIVAYLAASVPNGQICQPQARVCNNGVLSGSYNFSSCTVDQPASCQFNGMTVPSGSQVVAYATSTVPFGQSCTPLTRTCTNGVLSGTGNFGSCAVDQPMSCIFNGTTIAHNQEVTAYAAASVPFGSSCQSEKRKCNNGTLSGSYQSNACVQQEAAACSFNGQTIAHSQSVTAYATNSVAYGQTCTPTTRTCNNGVLSGSGAYASCVVGPASSCTFNGQTIAHGSPVTAYPSASVPYGQACTAQTRVCNNGILSGSASAASCTVQAPASCSFGGQTIGHGGSVAAYAAPVVGYGSSCSLEYRTCNNGSLGGSYGYTSCQVAQPSELWTYQGHFFQTACSKYTWACDGMQQVNCSGSGCPGSRWLIYGASAWQVPPYSVGSQTTTRPSFIGTQYSENCDAGGIYTYIYGCQ